MTPHLSKPMRRLLLALRVPGAYVAGYYSGRAVCGADGTPQWQAHQATLLACDLRGWLRWEDGRATLTAIGQQVAQRLQEAQS